MTAATATRMVKAATRGRDDDVCRDDGGVMIMLATSSTAGRYIIDAG